MEEDEFKVACNPDNFREAARQFEKMYLVFLNDECPPCNLLKKEIADADIPHQVVYAPAEKCADLANYYGVRATPTVLLLEKGEARRVHTNENPSKIVARMKEGK